MSAARAPTPRFAVGDHVRWNSEAGIVSGTIVRVHTRDTTYKGHVRHCSEDDPQYEIASDRTEHVAMHKGSALTRVERAPADAPGTGEGRRLARTPNPRP